MNSQNNYEHSLREPATNGRLGDIKNYPENHPRWWSILIESTVLTGVLGVASLILVLLANYYVFTVVPNEQIMGAVQRIFYFHVAFAIIAYILIGLLFVTSVSYLVFRNVRFDNLSHSAVSVAFLCCTIVLVSGMIWGHSAWNVWWRWEPRLVSFLVLWLILFSTVILRKFTEGGSVRERNFSAVLGIVAAVNVPMVVFSIKLLDRAEQLHPQVIANQGLSDERFVYGLVLALVAGIVLAAWLFVLKLRNIVLHEEIIALRREAMYIDQ